MWSQVNVVLYVSPFEHTDGSMSTLERLDSKQLTKSG